jgi:hypothetical protein
MFFYVYEYAYIHIFMDINLYIHTIYTCTCYRVLNFAAANVSTLLTTCGMTVVPYTEEMLKNYAPGKTIGYLLLGCYICNFYCLYVDSLMPLADLYFFVGLCIL